MTICKGNLEKTIEALEASVKSHEEAYEKHPQMLGYEDGFYSHKERAEEHKEILGYLKELQEYRRGEHK